ncbi:MAG: molybdopterin molybdotransferase MoeA [Saprospiraceae bacterium]|nr:molybdopterin molybdotransferase MoeA [Saprospiraceae bacterium]
MKGPYLIAFEEALSIVIEQSPRLGIERIPVAQAGGRILAEAIYAPADMPPFDNSAMDGYALKWIEGGDTAYTITGEIPAGTMPTQPVHQGECQRIFTGAPMPDGADTVVQQEWTEEQDGRMIIRSGQVVLGAHIRRKGTHIGHGELAMAEGYFLSPGAVGFLASMGIATVPVYRKPRVSILVTGSELIPPGQPIQGAQIYESNSHTLQAGLAETGIHVAEVVRVADDEVAFGKVYASAVAQSDIVLITGGISVGDHDIVRSTFEKGTIETYFYKVKQRPGNPLYFGRQDSALVFALPGNPASVMSCFYQYVRPCIRKMSGHETLVLERRRMPIAKTFTKKKGLTFFLKAKLQGDEVLPLEGQLSYIMRSFAEADCIIILDQEIEIVEAGTMVDVQLLPHDRT